MVSRQIQHQTAKMALRKKKQKYLQKDLQL